MAWNETLKKEFRAQNVNSPANKPFGESRAHTTQFQAVGTHYTTTASDYGRTGQVFQPTFGHHTRSVGDAYGNRGGTDSRGTSQRIM